eukprot:4898368-Pyramimonas_sp.AAC.1
MIRAWMLSHHMRDPQRTSIHEMCARVFRLALPEAQADELISTIGAKVPKFTRPYTLNRLAYLEILYQRTLVDVGACRLWMADSSPQPPFNFYLVLEDRV